jgi:carboxypeptidase Taq
MDSGSAAYSTLEQRFRRIAHVQGALAVLNWDSAVNMPPGGAGARADQLSTLAVTAHELLTAPAVGDLLDTAEAASDALNDAWARANLAEMRRLWRHAHAVPQRLVEALSKAAHDCEMVWREARAANDWPRLRPHLDALLGLVREQAAAKAAAFGLDPYDALLDEHEPGGRAARIDVLFAELETYLPDLLGRVLDAQARRPAARLPKGPFPVEAQRALAEQLMRALGFDAEHGRLDVSHHPFTGGVPDDVRITTRYTELDFARSLMGVIHETGHALYERGLPLAWRNQPVGNARGMVLHESQSLLMEMQACRSPQFIAFAAPLMRAAFGGDGPDWEPANLLRLYQRVQPGLIRVDADEVTYPSHVILRYGLERRLIAGELAVADLPDAWRAGMKRLLNVAVPDDRDGVMQDIHWPSGAFGYFPTYTLGAIAAAQLFAAAKRAVPEILPGIAQADFAPLLGWLRAHVHGQGSFGTTDEILVRATGAPLGLDAYKAHLEARYLGD